MSYIHKTCSHVYIWRKQLLGRELGPVQMYTGDVHMWHTGIYIPLCFWAMVSARARLLPPAEWATASTNSFQDGSPKRVRVVHLVQPLSENVFQIILYFNVILVTDSVE